MPLSASAAAFAAMATVSCSIWSVWSEAPHTAVSTPQGSGEGASRRVRKSMYWRLSLPKNSSHTRMMRDGEVCCTSSMNASTP